ncbi:OmpA family protein [Candidatus Entotheonella palauensis]|nr:OmpA family protein [Candidatus Entotheonella palauensis]
MKTINTLHWTGLPPGNRRQQPLTIILRNNRQIGSTFDSQFPDDKALPSGNKVEYQVVQQGRDGVFYKSNSIESQFSPKTFRLAVQVIPEDSIISLYTGGPGLSRPLEYVKGMELPAGNYVLDVEREGYETDRRNVAIADRDVTLTVKLKAEETKYALRIDATPSDSTIKIMNIHPKYRPGILLAPGRYDILVERTGYVRQRQGITIRDRNVEHNFVLNAVPIAVLSGPKSGVADQLMSFSAIDSNDPDGTITLYKWDYGDGDSFEATFPRATHRYFNPDKYIVRLTVEDDQGATAAASQQVLIHEEAKVSISATVLFDFDRSELRPDSIAELEPLLQVMQADSTLKASIVGHTNNRENALYNLGLSERLAQAVADYLMDGGIASNRLKVEGRGESEPVASNDTPEGRQQNRRVEIVVSSQ